VAALIQAVRKFEVCEFPRDHLIRHAERWSVPEFQRRMRMAVVAFVDGSASSRGKGLPDNELVSPTLDGPRISFPARKLLNFLRWN